MVRSTEVERLDKEFMQWYTDQLYGGFLHHLRELQALLIKTRVKRKLVRLEKLTDKEGKEGFLYRATQIKNESGGVVSSSISAREALRADLLAAGAWVADDRFLFIGFEFLL